MCWRQAANARTATAHRRPYRPLDLAGANRHGQQLFFADVHRPARLLASTRQLRATTVRAQTPIGTQLGFFDGPPPRVAGLDRIADEHARRYGWGPATLKRVRRGIRLLIDTPHPPASIRASQVAALAASEIAVTHLLEVLAEAGILTDDRPDILGIWFRHQVAELPPQMTDELAVWFRILADGSATSPRSRPRAPVTIKTRLRWALPALKQWAASGHQSLREITAADIAAVLPPGGNPRATLGAGLRSIFGILKAHRVVFVNPTARIDIGAIERRQPLPVDPGQLRNALQSPDPARATVSALIAFHGLRPSEIRHLALTDIRDSRIYLPDRTIPLAGPVKTRLAAYLNHRNQRWPRTANGHLFIHYRTANTTGPVGYKWLRDTLGFPPSALRQDRILDEVHATGGDVRRVSDLFGVSVKTAIHYSTVLEHPDLR